MNNVSHIESFFEGQLDSNLLNAFPAGVIVCDAQGKIEQYNNELLTLFGYGPGELEKQTVDILLPDTLQKQHKDYIRQFFRQPEKRNMGSGRDLYGKRKDGSTFPIEIGLTPIDSTKGHRVLATVADISQRTRIESNFMRVVQTAPVGMLILSASGRISVANQPIETIFGFTRDELQDKPIEMLLPERYREQHPNLRRSFHANPQTRSMGLDRDLTGLHKNGTEIPVEIGLSPIETEEGLAVVATVVDITERKKAELAIKQANADLDEFTYVASHDLRSPLRGISSLLEWIEEDLEEELKTLPEGIQNNLSRAYTRIGRMEKLIDDLLAYARAGRVQDSLRDVDLAELLSDLVTFIEPPESFKIQIDCQADTIKSQKTPLETIIRNLVSNAIKHHHQEQGNIFIRTYFDDDYCVFEVEDDGPGIPEAAQQRVFKLFQSLSSKDKTRSGVGLAVSKRLAEAHGGYIRITSVEGKPGSCFRVYWPRFTRSDLHE